MKRKTCIICKTKLISRQQLFCSNECYLIGMEDIKKERAYLDKQKELVELETEVLYAKKQNLIMRESIGFDSPFTANYKDKVPYNLID